MTSLRAHARNISCLLGSLGVLLLLFSPLCAQQDGRVTFEQGLVGANQTPEGSEVVIFTMVIDDNFPPGPFRVNDLGNAVAAARGVEVIISDLSVPTGLVAADFTELRLYRDSAANSDAWDPGDILMATTAPVNIGAATLLDVSALPTGIGTDRRLSLPPGDHFFVTAVISPTATKKHTFRVGTVAGYVGFNETGTLIPAGDYTDGLTVAASDANHMVIGAQSASTAAQIGGSIPFGGEGAILVLLVGSGLYMIRRHSR